MVDGAFGDHGQTARWRVEEGHRIAVVTAIILHHNMVEKIALEIVPKHNRATLNRVQVSYLTFIALV